MAKYVQKHKNTGYHVDAAELAEADAVEQAHQREAAASGHTDEVLADIDEALQGLLGNETDQEFLNSFVQKGGE